MADEMSSMVGSFKNLPHNDQRQMATAILQEMAASDAQGAVHDAGIGAPSQGIADRLWMIVVSTLAVVMVLAVVGLVIALFVKVQGSASADVILTVFTTSAAGLIGLFVPSPAQGSSKQSA